MILPTPARGVERGTALVEALVALAVFAAMLGVTYGAITDRSRAARLLQTERQAVGIAQSVLARAGSDIALAPGVVDGREGDFAWQIEMERYQGEGAPPVGGPPLIEVTVAVHPLDAGKPRVALRSLRVAS